MSNSQPEIKSKEKKTRSSRPRLKDKFKKLIPKKKRKPAHTSTGKLTRKEQKAEKKKTKPRRRAFPIWLRIIVVLLLCAIALIVGAMVGYGIMGSGKPSDVFDMETWRHVSEIVLKKDANN